MGDKTGGGGGAGPQGHVREFESSSMRNKRLSKFSNRHRHFLY